MLTASPRLAAIDPPEEPLPVWRCLRTMVDNPLKAWPAAFYREPLYRSRILGHPTVYVMAPDLVRAVLLDESDSFEKGEDARRALGSALGDAILRRAKPAHATASRWRASFAAMGTLAIALTGWVPLLGSVVTFIALLLGVGAVVFQIWAATSGNDG